MVHAGLGRLGVDPQAQRGQRLEEAAEERPVARDSGPVLVSLQERLWACAEQSRRKREPGELVAGWKPHGAGSKFWIRLREV